MRSEAFGRARRITLQRLLQGTALAVAGTPAWSAPAQPAAIIDLSLAVQVPAQPGDKADVGAPGNDAALMRAIKAVAANDMQGLRFDFVAPGQAHRLKLVLDKNQLTIHGHRGGAALSDPRANAELLANLGDIWQRGAGQRLHAHLLKIGRYLNLLRLSEAMPRPSPRSGVLAAANLRRSDRPDMALDLRGIIDARDEDILDFRITNPGRDRLAVTALYVDAQFDLQVLYPDEKSRPGIDPGDTKSFEIAINASTIGAEELWLIATRGDDGDGRQDLRFLAEEPMAFVHEHSVGRIEPVRDAFRIAAFGSLRNRPGPVNRTGVPPDTNMLRIRLNVAPRS